MTEFVLAAGMCVLAAAFILHLRMHSIRDRSNEAIAQRILDELQRHRDE